MLIEVTYGGGTILVNKPTADLMSLREELGVLTLDALDPEEDDCGE